MKAPVWLCAACLTLTSVPSMGAVIATFADPDTLSFSFADTGSNTDGFGDLTALNNDISVNLPVLGLTFSDASYTMTDTGGGALSTTSQSDTTGGLVEAVFEGGKVEIRTDIAEHGLAPNDLLLTISFDMAVGIFGTVFGADSLMGHNVSFSGPALNGLVPTAEQFSFTSVNLAPFESVRSPADMEDWTSTTSFTSSATLVPVPPAVWLLGSGLVGLAGIARRRKAA